MQNVVPVLKALTDTNSKLAKLRILKSLSGREEEVVKEYLRLGCDPSITYGVNTTTLNGIDINPFGTRHVGFEEVQKITLLLANRDLSGTGAIKAIRQLINSGNRDDAKWIKALLVRKLRIGLGVETINEVWPGLIVELPFALAKKIKPGTTFKNQWIVEPKLDGIRAMAVYNFELAKWEFWSRENNTLFNTELIDYQLATKIGGNFVLDGELIADNWNLTDSIVHTKSVHPLRHTLKFYVFDVISLDEWHRANPSSSESLVDRKYTLGHMFGGIKFGTKIGVSNIYKTEHTGIRLVSGDLYSDTDTIHRLAASYLQDGFEGAVVKRADSPYPFKRSSDWLKIKFEDTIDAKIIDTVEGEGKYVGMLGSLVVDVNGASVKVGGGYSDAQRDSFWQDRSNLIGKTLEFKVQKDPKDAIDIVARFPVFVRFRDDK